MEDEPEEQEFTDYIENKEIIGGKTDMNFRGGAKEINIKGGSHKIKINGHVETLNIFGGFRDLQVKSNVDNLIIQGGISKLYIHNYTNTKVNKLKITGGTHEIWIYTAVDEIFIRGGVIKLWANFENAKILKLKTIGGQREIYLNSKTNECEKENEGGICNIHVTDPVPEPIDYQDSLSENTLKITTLQNQKFDEHCAICLNDFKPGDQVYFLPCIHFYHVNCLRGWVKKGKICPRCKLKFNNKLE
jgi:hypothetical protein